MGAQAAEKMWSDGAAVAAGGGVLELVPCTCVWRRQQTHQGDEEEAAGQQHLFRLPARSPLGVCYLTQDAAGLDQNSWAPNFEPVVSYRYPYESCVILVSALSLLGYQELPFPHPIWWAAHVPCSI